MNNDEGSPRAFYALTPEARDVFALYGIFPTDGWQHAYESVEKPLEIQRLGELSRPDDLES